MPYNVPLPRQVLPGKQLKKLAARLGTRQNKYEYQCYFVFHTHQARLYRREGVEEEGMGGEEGVGKEEGGREG